MGKINQSFALLLVLLFLIPLGTIQHSTVKAQTRTIVVPNDYSDIQTAINHANNGDTVFVRAGTYKTADYGIIVNKSISLIGENRNTIISKNDWYHGSFYAVNIESDNITFSGFTITSSNESKIGLGSESLSILGSNSIIDNNNFHLPLVGSGNNQRISNCTFEGADYFGMVVHFSNSIIIDNIITDNYLGGIGISSKSSNVTIKGNNISNNGVASHGTGISLTTLNEDINANISIYQNNITNNSRFGIQFNGPISNSLIFSNNIANNGVGINLSNFALRKYSQLGSGTKIFYNNLVGNGKNAFIETAYPYNLTSDMLHDHHMIGNGTDVVSWDNGVVGNYWGDYSGIGSYVIDENNTDHYPLTQPVDVNSIAPTPNAGSPPMTITVIIAIVVLVAIITGLMVYFKKRKQITKLVRQSSSSRSHYNYCLHILLI
jgi:hypothetical protein